MDRKALERKIGIVIGSIESALENPNLTDDFVLREIRLVLEQLARDIKRVEREMTSNAGGKPTQPEA